MFAAVSCSAQHRIEKIWETDSTIAVPESVLAYGDILYVSQVDGQALAADGKGEIGKLDRNGKIIDANWVTGLNAPKGMGIYQGKLYVTDITKVLVISLSNGKVEYSIPVKGSAGLNDLTIDTWGVIYVSDAELGRVYRIKNGIPELYLDGLKGANGLKAIGRDLYILTGSNLFKSVPGKKLVSLASVEPGGDGLEPVGNDEFLLTRYTGVMYYLDKNGMLQTLLDTRGEKKGSADIAYDASRRIIYVPTLFKKTVVAYKLK